MKHIMNLVLVVCYSTMTSFAQKSQKYVMMANSTGAKVCSTDAPSQVFPISPGEDMQCGLACVMSSACPYFQLKSTTPIQCELYNQFPLSFAIINKCIGFRTILPSFLPRDCADIVNFFGAMMSGVYTVYVGSNYRPITVYCDMNSGFGGWTMFQRRYDGSVNFDIDWVSYAQGFGDVNGEFWIGNDNLNLLTTAKRYKLRIRLGDFSNNTRYAEYNNFVVNSAADKYRLASLGTYAGTAGDSFSYNQGMQFTTRDQDNDLNSGGNCAALFQGPWWYNNCMYCNLNSIYINGSNGPSDNKGIKWFGWYAYNTSTVLKTTEMQIKPMN